MLQAPLPSPWAPVASLITKRGACHKPHNKAGCMLQASWSCTNASQLVFSPWGHLCKALITGPPHLEDSLSKLWSVNGCCMLEGSGKPVFTLGGLSLAACCWLMVVPVLHHSLKTLSQDKHMQGGLQAPLQGMPGHRWISHGCTCFCGTWSQVTWHSTPTTIMCPTIPSVGAKVWRQNMQ